MKLNRRKFIRDMSLATAGITIANSFVACSTTKTAAGPFFELSLAEFSFAGSLFSGKMDHLDFAAKAKKDFNINHVEYVSGFWKEKKPTDQAYLKEMKKRSDDAGVKNHLIMVDGAGNLGASDQAKRAEAIASHLQWIEAAKALDCKAIRVNLDGDGSDEEVAKACVDGYGKLVELGEKNELNILVENHIGPSVNPDWLVGIMSQVTSPRAGMLVDTANFIRYQMESMTLEAFKSAKVVATFDKYEGVRKLMPFAKGVSAKTHQFDDQGNDKETDFVRILQIVKDSGFNGLIGVEYEGAFLKQIMGMEGNYPPEDEGVRMTKTILENAAAKLS
jgi:sugar phosphate isomerase/epimerase